MLGFLVIVIFVLVFYKNRTQIGPGPGKSPSKSSVSEDRSLDWKDEITMPAIDFTPTAELLIVTMNEYIPQDVYDHFTATYGTRIVETKVTSNEDQLELLDKFPEKYDVLTTGDYMVTKMIHSGLLHKLDREQLPNMANLDADVLRSDYDLGLKYSVPLFRTSLGIVFDIEYVSGIPRYLEFLFTQVHNPYLAYRIGLIKEMRFALGASLMSLGYSPNTIVPEQINAARDRLIQMVNRYGLTFMDEKNDDEALASDTILLAMHWNGTAATALLEKSDVNFLLPEGQAIVTIDSAVISARSKRIQTAQLFVNYLLIPQVAARMTNYNCFANCITGSMPYVRRIIRNGPGFIFPEEENRLFLKDLGGNLKLYEDAWAMVLAAKPSDKLVRLPLPKSGLFQGGAKSSGFTDQDDKEITTAKTENQ